MQLIAHSLDWELEVCGVPIEYAHPTHDLFPIYTTTHHQLMDTSRIRYELGYRDLVPVGQAMQETVRWMLEYRAESAASSVDSDPLRYAVEDRLLAIHDQACAHMREIEFDRIPLAHPYPHPKRPGAARDERGR